MLFTPLAVYDMDGNFYAYTIGKVDDGVLKLHTTNLWHQDNSDDLMEQVERLNDQGSVLAYWPDARDPEVQALLDDETWMPVDRIPVEVPDNEKSVFVYTEQPREEDGFPGSVDEELSVIVMKTVMAPSPADTMRRVKAACETVARRRAENV